MGKRFGIFSGVTAAGIMIPLAAFAFEQQQVPAGSMLEMRSQPPAAVQPDIGPNLQFDGKASPSTNPDENAKVIKIPGLNKVVPVPKLNFGLDLMYGADQKDDLSLGFTNDPLVDNDVSIMGKVKRRF